MKRAILACVTALTLAGCMIFDDDFIEDEPDACFAPSAGH